MKSTLGWFQRLTSSNKRKTERIEEPTLVAFYWDGDKPREHVVRDISTAGLYLVTDDRWYPRTLVRLTLQPIMEGKGAPERSITVETMVVRQGSDGVGVTFIYDRGAEASGSGPVNGADRKMLETFLKRISVSANAPAKSTISILQ